MYQLFYEIAPANDTGFSKTLERRFNILDGPPSRQGFGEMYANERGE